MLVVVFCYMAFVLAHCTVFLSLCPGYRVFMNVCVFSLVFTFFINLFCFRLKMKTCTVLVLCLVGCVALKKDGEKVYKRKPNSFYYDYGECEGGSGACGYCSSTCDPEGKGCSIVPKGTIFPVLV